jgi:hypothetical protein
MFFNFFEHQQPANCGLMWRKRNLVLFIALFSIGMFISTTINAAGWTRTVIVAAPAVSAPTVDGVKESVWTDLKVNVTYHTLQSGRQVAVSACTFGNALYILVEARYTSTAQNESISVFIANNNQTTNQSALMDKKMITFFNATEYGNETSIALDFYQVTLNNYTLDENSPTFTGAAKFAGPTRNPRVYEFLVPFTPDNATFDNTLTFGQNYTIKVGINNTESDLEISDALLVQLGETLLLKEDKIGEFKFDPKQFLTVVLIIIAVVYGIVGIVIIDSHKNVEPIEEIPEKFEDKPEKPSEEEDSEEVEEEDE